MKEEGEEAAPARVSYGYLITQPLLGAWTIWDNRTSARGGRGPEPRGFKHDSTVDWCSNWGDDRLELAATALGASVTAALCDASAAAGEARLSAALNRHLAFNHYQTGAADGGHRVHG